jgi:three-Cys-motif partner protein
MKNPIFRSTQTQVKHQILTKYLDTWGGIIVNGLRSTKQTFRKEFIYVDCFAYKGKYLGNKEDEYTNSKGIEPVYGSPIIGIKAMDKLRNNASGQGIEITVNSILIEKNKENYKDLKDTLFECGYLSRIKESINFNELNNGDIALINDDATLHCNDLTEYTNRQGAWSFYLVDPYGPSGYPFNFVKSIVSGNHHDVMINFIYEDLVRKMGMLSNTQLSPKHQKLIKNWENAFSVDNWAQIIKKTQENEYDADYWIRNLSDIPLDDIVDSQDITNDQLIEIKERAFVFGYQKTLESMDPNIAIKLSSLRFPDKERTMLYLFLTTHDPTGALELNRILYDTKYFENELRNRYKAIKNVPAGQMCFWDPTADLPQSQKSERFNIEEISSDIFEEFKGLDLPLKQVYFKLVNTIYFPSEIKKALRYLRRKGDISYEGNSLSTRTMIRFSGK